MNAFTACLVIVTLVTIFSAQVIADCNNISKTGFALTGHAYLTFLVQDFMQCYDKCKADEPECRSLNYHGDTKQCDLNNATKTSHPGDMRRSPMVTYFESYNRGK